MTPTALIIRTAGTNCDRELAHAFKLAGAQTITVHLNQLIKEPKLIDQAHLIGIPGGFSYGDDIAAGRIFSNRLRHQLFEPLIAAIDRSVPMIGICNGFQVLVKLGLLPNPLQSNRGAHQQNVTLADNTNGRFLARWVELHVPPETACVWTRGMKHIELPIAHAEGRFVSVTDSVLQKIWDNHQVALRYRINPNGSVNNIAGICDSTGLVLGLMPHPERWTHWTNHPRWTRWSKTQQSSTPDGLQMFKNAVEYVVRSTPTPDAQTIIPM